MCFFKISSHIKKQNYAITKGRYIEDMPNSYFLFVEAFFVSSCTKNAITNTRASNYATNKNIDPRKKLSGSCKKRVYHTAPK